MKKYYVFHILINFFLFYSHFFLFYPHFLIWQVTTPFVTNTNKKDGKIFSLDHSHILNELNRSPSNDDENDESNILYRNDVSTTSVTYSPSPSHDKHDSENDTEIKEEDEMSLKRKRSKSFSELLLPQFKEIIPITSYREMGLSLNDDDGGAYVRNDGGAYVRNPHDIPSSSSGIVPSGMLIYISVIMY